MLSARISSFIIHQTHYEKSDWSRAFNQFTIACELDMINAISAADSAFIMSSSTSAWLLSSLDCSPQKRNGWTLRFCFWRWIVWKICLCYLPQPSAAAENSDLGFDNSWYHAQPHPIITQAVSLGLVFGFLFFFCVQSQIAIWSLQRMRH